MSGPSSHAMVVSVAPAPTIVRLSVMSRSPVASVSSSTGLMLNLYGPAGRLIVSAPGLALAVMIAPRKLQSLGASVHVVAEASSSKRSTLSVGGTCATDTTNATLSIRQLTAPLINERDSAISLLLSSIGGIFSASAAVCRFLIDHLKPERANVTVVLEYTDVGVIDRTQVTHIYLHVPPRGKGRQRFAQSKEDSMNVVVALAAKRGTAATVGKSIILIGKQIAQLHNCFPTSFL